MNISSRKRDNCEIAICGDFPSVAEVSVALRTAQHADMYAKQLRNEFHELLCEAIARTDKRVAGRFTSLLNELCVMTGDTVNNIKKERLL